MNIQQFCTCLRVFESLTVGKHETPASDLAFSLPPPPPPDRDILLKALESWCQWREEVSVQQIKWMWRANAVLKPLPLHGIK